MTVAIDERLQLDFDTEQRRRWIAGRETIIHCHHYNSRIQSTIESATAIDGKAIFVSSAEAVFGQQIRDNIQGTESEQEKWQFATELFSHLGFGKLDVTELDRGVVTSPSSHFAEGWMAGFPSRREPVCSLTEGYLQGAYAAITGEPVYFREVACQIDGAECCRFEVSRERTEPAASYNIETISTQCAAIEALHSSTVDEAKIVHALAEMPIFGNADGLIPAFNVYLACTPADFYNLATIRFLEAMDEKHLGDVARTQLIHAGETCGLNTFRGILDSAEWDSLIAPMVHSKEDELFGIIAVSNGLGWGNWHLTRVDPANAIELQTRNSYESIGYKQMRGKSSNPTCLMLTGVAAGIFELVYGEGSIDERFGICETEEVACICQGDDQCDIRVTAV